MIQVHDRVFIYRGNLVSKRKNASNGNLFSPFQLGRLKGIGLILHSTLITQRDSTQQSHMNHTSVHFDSHSHMIGTTSLDSQLWEYTYLQYGLVSSRYQCFITVVLPRLLNCVQ